MGTLNNLFSEKIPFRKMNSKILILAFVACYQVTNAQRPTALPMPFGTGVPPFLGSFNNNWVRPYYAAAAEGWRTYFEQLQQARNQLYHTLTNLQNTAQNASGAARDTITQILSALPVHTKQANDDDETHQILGDLQAPAVETPAHDVPQEVQIVQTVTRPQVQSDVPKARPTQQVTVTHAVSQSQPASRQPQNVGLQGVTTGTRPATPQVTSSVLPQVSSGVVPQVGSGVVSQVSSGVVPQVSSPIIPQVGSQMVPQLGSQVPSWVGK